MPAGKTKHRSPIARVIGLGQASVDHIGSLRSFPQENEKAELRDLYIGCGGPVSTALVTLSRLDISTAFIGAVSDDLFGRRIVKTLTKERVDIHSLKITPGYTSQFAFICITGRGGKRTIFWHPGNAPCLGREDVDLFGFAEARLLHLDGLMMEASIEAAKQAKTLGMTVVYDAGTMREGSKELASLVDILIASQSFAIPLVGKDASPEDALSALEKLGPNQVVVTLGEKGSIGLKDGEFILQKAFPISAIDTTGAGDVYHGAYIYGVLQDWEMPEAMRFASAAAALKCEKIGAQTGIPRLKIISEFMNAHKEI